MKNLSAGAHHASFLVKEVKNLHDCFLGHGTQTRHESNCLLEVGGKQIPQQYKVMLC